MKILIADDNKTSRKLLELAFIGKAECEFAGTGVEALHAYSEAESDGRPFDLIILDVLMPGMDGLEVLKRIRADETGKGVIFRNRVKIAMATRLHDRDTVMTAFRDQCDGYITKPFGPGSVMTDLVRQGIL